MKIRPLVGAILLTLFSLVLGASTARAGWQKDSVCQGSCGGGCGPCSGSSSSGGGGGGGGGPHWGHATEDTIATVKRCNNPLCVVFQSGIGFPMAAIIDGPYYAVKGVGAGLKYGAIGIGKGATAVGHGIAYPFKQASAASQRSAAASAEKARAAQAPVNCGASAGESFEAYRGWEGCKRGILDRQKALTKADKTNKANESWCKGHVPLGSGPNTSGWLDRCNPGGATPPAPAAAQAAAPIAAPAAPAGPATAAPAEPALPAAEAPAALDPAAKAASDRATAAAAAAAAALGGGAPTP